jgi:hypothetical protein
MPIHLDCPICGQRLQVSNAARGRTLQCVACGNAVRVPEPKSMLEAKTAESTEALALGHKLTRAQGSLSAWLESLANRPILLLGVVVLFVVAALGIKTALWAAGKFAHRAPTATIQEAVDPEPWDGAGTSDANDRVRVTLKSATVEPITVVEPESNRVHKTPKSHLKIVLEIQNLSPSEAVQYSRWSTHADTRAQSAKLSDDTGAVHQQVDWSERIVDQLNSMSIQPSGKVEELLVFPYPGKYSRYLKLALPAQAIGGTHDLRIKIPWTRSAD